MFEDHSGVENGSKYVGDLRTEIFSRLEQNSIRLDTDQKDQHLLISRQAIDQLVDSAHVNQDDTVLEIGPGPGQITEVLSQKAQIVHAIEIDTRFEPILGELQSRHPNVDVMYGSALDLKWPSVRKVVANPPFSILEPLLMRLATEKKIEEISLVLGRRYYQRYIARDDYPSRTALITSAFFNLEMVSSLAPDNFYPQSREDSVIVRLTRKSKHEADSGLKTLASRLIRTPKHTVGGMLNDIVSESLDPRKIMARGYETIPSISSLGIPQEVLKKRLQELDNREIGQIASALRSFRRGRR